MYDRPEQFYVYIMTNNINTVLYTGFSNDLVGRVWQHKNKVDPNSFTARYNINKLVYFEICDSAYEALNRERQIKAGSRAKKIALNKSMNPEFRDLYDDL